MAYFPHMKQLGGSLSTSIATPVSSSKTRIRWTQDLHDRFVECVKRLSGPDTICRCKIDLSLIPVCCLNFRILNQCLLCHKYRNAKYVPESVEGRSEKKSSTTDVAEVDIEAHIFKIVIMFLQLVRSGMQLGEALQLQLDIQRRLHDQLESERKLQLRIEERAQQLKMMFEQQQKTRRNLPKSTHSDSKRANNSNPTLEDSEVTVSEGSEDDTVFPQGAEHQSI
ncbi:hypothetical protein CDL12_07337 [Handroanthus impetiginosus]|uniref:MYB-CC type transcription factor LHEQLE-containing domain-containing protein n=1 Tax=Handroanthus impetiginosus TaxID=429701 RepID=A0A2G9HR59_9LAMI|nr:hypothetical protein CDL12_29391 [Handroanthus impetiginosus]PIN20012.1 hypothetical protein CDL12_07337 [Handroanthus impetiginosus]